MEKVKSVIPSRQIELKGIKSNFPTLIIRLILNPDGKTEESLWHVALFFANKVPRGQKRAKLTIRMQEVLPQTMLPDGLMKYPHSWHAGIAAAHLAKFARVNITPSRNDQTGNFDLSIGLTIESTNRRGTTKFSAAILATAGTYERFFTPSN